jgi:hypothetical protein
MRYIRIYDDGDPYERDFEILENEEELEKNKNFYEGLIFSAIEHMQWYELGKKV